MGFIIGGFEMKWEFEDYTINTDDGEIV